MLIPEIRLWGCKLSYLNCNIVSFAINPTAFALAEKNLKLEIWLFFTEFFVTFFIRFIYFSEMKAAGTNSLMFKS